MSHPDMTRAINDAIGAHGAWKFKLKSAVARGESALSPQTVQRDDCCDFGRWLYGPTIEGATRNGMPYKVVRRLHAEFHVCAAEVLSKAVSGERTEAATLLSGAFSERSHRLVTALTKWKLELGQKAA